MRSLWNGSISFGLVNIPIKMYAATERQSVKFRYLHKKCQTPIKYEKVCPTCQTEVQDDEIVYGYEYERGRFIIIDEEELAALPSKQGRTIDIVDFVNLTEIDPVYFDKTYYLEPTEGGAKPYILLRQAMEATGRIAIAKVQLRSKESLAAIRAAHNALVMETMFFPDEVRSTQALSGLDQPVDIHENELKMAVSLIENLADKFDPAKYTDTYREELLRLIEQKVAGEEIVTPEVPPRTGKVVDLMAALEASVKATQKEKDKDTKGAKKRSTQKRKVKEA
jgi:DNA end-binding protein Ku